MNTITPTVDGYVAWHAGLASRDFGGSILRLSGPQAAARGRCSGQPDLGARHEAHAMGLKVLPWTVNDPADMARLIDMGVDGIITDYPDRLRRVMEEGAGTAVATGLPNQVMPADVAARRRSRGMPSPAAPRAAPPGRRRGRGCTSRRRSPRTMRISGRGCTRSRRPRRSPRP